MNKIMQNVFVFLMNMILAIEQNMIEDAKGEGVNGAVKVVICQWQWWLWGCSQKVMIADEGVGTR